MIRRHMFTNKFFVLKSNLSYSSLEFVRHYSILKWWTLPWFI